MHYEVLYGKILGSLTNALIGDAMGSATETMTPEEILRRYGGKITRFYPPPQGTYAAGRRAGELTDDSSQMLLMVDAILESGDSLRIEKVAEKLLAWAEDPEMLARFAGPSTRKALAMLRDGKSPHETGLPDRIQNDLRVSNGAAMKISPVGLVHPGNVDAAIADAVLMSTPTHLTNVAFSGAAAVGAAVAEAMSAHPTLLSISDAALYGAEEGDRIGRERGSVIASPSVSARLKLAIEIACSSRDLDATSAEIAAVIGCGLPIAEAVPTAIGIFLAARGDPLQSVTAVVNLGDDSDTIATISGAISGAFMGIDSLDQTLVEFLLEANQIDLTFRAEGLARLAVESLRNE